jgi:hypothetical protein
MCSGFLCYVFGLFSLSTGLFFLWFLICGLVQVLFLSLVINFEFLSGNFPVTILGLDVFSGAYLNKLLCQWRTVIENCSV